MPTKRSTFRLTDDELARLDSIARDRKVDGRTGAIRWLIEHYDAGPHAAQKPTVADLASPRTAELLAVMTSAPEPSRVMTENPPVVMTPKPAVMTCKGGPYTDRGGMSMCDTCGRPRGRH